MSSTRMYSVGLKRRRQWAVKRMRMLALTRPRRRQVPALGLRENLRPGATGRRKRLGRRVL